MDQLLHSRLSPLLFILALLVLIPAVLGAPVCYFPLEKMVLTRDEVSECLNSIPYDQAVAIQTTDNVLAYLDAFVFVDYLKAPEAPYEDLQTNIVDCVTSVRQQIASNPTAFPSDYAFHQKLSDIFLPYRDPHTMYSKPSCYQKFTWLLPIALHSVLVDGTQRLVVDHLPPEYAFYEVGYWEVHGGVPDGLYGAEIQNFGTNESPIEFLARWADEHVYSSKSRDSRFNSALTDEFWMLGGRYYGVPDISLTVTVASEPIEIFWGATNKVSLYGTSDFASYCPVLDVPWSDQAKLYPRTRIVEGETLEHRRIHPMKRLAEEMSKTRVDLSEGDNTPFLRKLVSTPDVSFYLYEPEQATDDVVVMLSIPSFSPDDVDSFTSNFLKGIDMCNELGITHLIVNLMGNGGGWVTLGYRVLRVLAPWVYPVYGWYDVRHSSLSDILLDSALSESVQVHYNHDTNLPYGGTSWYTDSVAKSFTEFSGCPKGLGCSQPSSEVEDTKAKNVAAGQEYTYDYSQRYYFTVAYDEHDFVDAFNRLDSSPGLHYARADGGEQTPLPAQNIIFLSDGLCGSTCACTSKRAQEAHAGIIVGVGGILGAPPADMDVASFAGGSVSDNRYMEPYLTPGDYSTANNIPFPMPTDAMFRFAFEEVYGWADPDALLEFHVNPVDLKLAYWPRTGSRWLEDAGELVRHCVDDVFGIYSSHSEAPDTTQTCLPWMVTPAESGRCSIANGRGGYPCRESGEGYDTAASCVVYSCAAGFYRTADRLACEPIPTPAEEPKGLSGGAIAAIVICCIIVVAVVVLAILIQRGIIRLPCKKENQEAKKALVEQSSEKSD